MERRPWREGTPSLFVVLRFVVRLLAVLLFFCGCVVAPTAAPVLTQSSGREGTFSDAREKALLTWKQKSALRRATISSPPLEKDHAVVFPSGQKWKKKTTSVLPPEAGENAAGDDARRNGAAPLLLEVPPHSVVVFSLDAGPKLDSHAFSTLAALSSIVHFSARPRALRFVLMLNVPKASMSALADALCRTIDAAVGRVFATTPKTTTSFGVPEQSGDAPDDPDHDATFEEESSGASSTLTTRGQRRRRRRRRRAQEEEVHEDYHRHTHRHKGKQKHSKATKHRDEHQFEVPALCATRFFDDVAVLPPQGTNDTDIMNCKAQTKPLAARVTFVHLPEDVKKYPKQVSDLVELFCCSGRRYSIARPELARSLGNHARFFAYLALLPLGVKRALFLDADVLARVDVKSLFATKLTRNRFVAAAKRCAPNRARYQPKFKFSDALVQSYGLKSNAMLVNAGVLVMDLEQYCAQHLLTDMNAILRKHVAGPPLWRDGNNQPPFTIAAAKHVAFVDPSWNVRLGDAKGQARVNARGRSKRRSSSGGSTTFGGQSQSEENSDDDSDSVLFSTESSSPPKSYTGDPCAHILRDPWILHAHFNPCDALPDRLCPTKKPNATIAKNGDNVPRALKQVILKTKNAAAKAKAQRKPDPCECKDVARLAPAPRRSRRHHGSSSSSGRHSSHKKPSHSSSSSSSASKRGGGGSGGKQQPKKERSHLADVSSGAFPTKETSSSLSDDDAATAAAAAAAENDDDDDARDGPTASDDEDGDSSEEEDEPAHSPRANFEDHDDPPAVRRRRREGRRSSDDNGGATTTAEDDNTRPGVLR